MGKLIIDAEYWNLFPQGKIGIVICKNVANTYGTNIINYENQIKNAEKIAKKELEGCEFLENSTVKIWREAKNGLISVEYRVRPFYLLVGN